MWSTAAARRRPWRDPLRFERFFRHEPLRWWPMNSAESSRIFDDAVVGGGQVVYQVWPLSFTYRLLSFGPAHELPCLSDRRTSRPSSTTWSLCVPGAAPFDTAALDTASCNGGTQRLPWHLCFAVLAYVRIALSFCALSELYHRSHSSR